MKIIFEQHHEYIKPRKKRTGMEHGAHIPKVVCDRIGGALFNQVGAELVIVVRKAVVQRRLRDGRGGQMRGNNHTYIGDRMLRMTFSRLFLRKSSKIITSALLVHLGIAIFRRLAGTHG